MQKGKSKIWCAGGRGGGSELWAGASHSGWSHYGMIGHRRGQPLEAARPEDRRPEELGWVYNVARAWRVVDDDDEVLVVGPCSSDCQCKDDGGKGQGVRG